MTNDELRQLAGTPDRAREIAERVVRPNGTDCIFIVPACRIADDYIAEIRAIIISACHEYGATIERERDAAHTHARLMTSGWKIEHERAETALAKLARVEAVCARWRRDIPPTESRSFAGMGAMTVVDEISDALTDDERKDPTG